MKRVSLREFRANLSTIIKQGNAVVIGDTYHFRAVLVPISETYNWDRGKRDQVVSAKRKARAILAEIEGNL